MFSQVLLGQGDEVGIVSSGRIQPEHGLGSGGSSSVYGKLHPVLKLTMDLRYLFKINFQNKEVEF